MSANFFGPVCEARPPLRPASEARVIAGKVTLGGIDTLSALSPSFVRRVFFESISLERKILLVNMTRFVA